MKTKQRNNTRISNDGLRVCFVAHSAGNLGAEAALLELLEALTNNGITCFVLLPCDGPFTEKLRSLKIGYSIVPYKSWLYKNISFVRRLGRAIFNILLLIPIAFQIRRWRCDLIYTNTIMIFVGALAARILRIPHIWHIHEFGKEDHGFKFDFGERSCCTFMNKLSDLTICVSKAIASKYERYIAQDKLKVVYQSVTMDPENIKDIGKAKHLRQPSAWVTCGIIGNLDHGKRQEDAITAITRIVDKGINIRLYVVGSGKREYTSQLQVLTEEMGVTGHVHFLGYREDFVSVIRSADIILTCSKCEGFGRITVHGMLCGKPIIGTNSGCTPELVRCGYNGLLYKPGDAEQLAAHIIYLHDNPETRKRLGQNGRKWAQNLFTKERYGREIKKLIHDVVYENHY